MPYVNVETRKQLHNRAEGKCEICGTTQNLEIHHIKSWRNGGTNKLDNLKLLCHDCHTKERIATWQRQGSFKTLHETFNIADYAKLLSAKEKSSLNWHDFIMQLATHTILPQVYHDVDKFYPDDDSLEPDLEGESELTEKKEKEDD